MLRTHKQGLTDCTQLQRIPENSPGTFEQPPDDFVAFTNTSDENQVEPDETATDNTELTSTCNRTQVTSRSNSTLYNLRSEPNPKTYRDFLVHELQVKLALLKFI